MAMFFNSSSLPIDFVAIRAYEISFNNTKLPVPPLRASESLIYKKAVYGNKSGMVE
ncbi:MAG: hypothetical protein K0R48_1378 [Gammaproteobacteria bacterium]|jgi:hypothetical protein|nr:hypothetical protein [Gammaproteobacteria bacterium]